MRFPKYGFTLIEFIVGMVLLVTAMTGILNLLINQAPRSVEPVLQIRAAQLASRLSNDILLKSFDEKSDHYNSHFRCGETVAQQFYGDCSCPINTACIQRPPNPPIIDMDWQSSFYGPDSESEHAPYAYNDVDDFDTAGNWVDASFFSRTSIGNDTDEYTGYQIKIAVSAAYFGLGSNTFDSCSIPCSVGKRIDLQVRLPDKTIFEFTFYRGNY